MLPQNNLIQPGKILVIDIPPGQFCTSSSLLSEHFDITLVSSLEECLEIIGMLVPDLVLVNISSLGSDIQQVFEKFSQEYGASIIFFADKDGAEMRMRALEAGAIDVIVHPFNPVEISQKIILAIDAKRQRDLEKANQEGIQELLFAALRNIGEKGILIDFQREIMGCRDHLRLAQHIVDTAAAYQIKCHVQIHGKHGILTHTPNGPASPLEESVFEHVRTLGPSFKFKRRFVVNFAAITILVFDLPVKDDEVSLQMQDNMILLAEGAQRVVEAIDVWSESGRQIEDMQTVSFQAHYGVEDLKARYKDQQSNIRSLLNKLITDVEDNYVYLGLSEAQESTLSESIRTRADEIVALVEVGQGEVEAKFDSILKLLRTESDDSIELF
jgi:CheY-like chemotaxis protein